MKIVVYTKLEKGNIFDIVYQYEYMYEKSNVMKNIKKTQITLFNKIQYKERYM